MDAQELQVSALLPAEMSKARPGSLPFLKDTEAAPSPWLPPYPHFAPCPEMSTFTPTQEPFHGESELKNTCVIVANDPSLSTVSLPFSYYLFIYFGF